MQCELVLHVYFVSEFKDTCTCTSEDGGGSAFGTCALAATRSYKILLAVSFNARMKII